MCHNLQPDDKSALASSTSNAKLAVREGQQHSAVLVQGSMVVNHSPHLPTCGMISAGAARGGGGGRTCEAPECHKQQQQEPADVPDDGHNRIQECVSHLLKRPGKVLDLHANINLQIHMLAAAFTLLCGLCKAT